MRLPSLPLPVLVVLALVCGLAPFDARAEEPRPVVVGIELHLPPDADATGISDKVVVKRGAPLSRTQVRRSVELLFATLRFSDVVVRQVPAPGGVRVIFELTPRRRLAAVEVDGERALTEAELIPASRLLEAEDLYPELLDEAAERVRALYGRRGWREATVSVEVHDDERGAVALILVEEGEPTHVTGVTVSGNPGLPLSRVLSTLGVAPGEVLDQERLSEGTNRLRALYREEGFYRARVGRAEVVEEGEGRASVAVPAMAGPRYTFAFEGNEAFPDKLLHSLIGWDGTEALDAAATDRMAQRLASFYRYRGYHDVKVSVREVRTPSQSRARLVFRFTEGKPLWVREVRFEGNEALTTDQLRAILADQVRTREPQPRGEVPPRIDPLATQGRAPGGQRAPSPRPEPLRVYVQDAYAEAARVMRDAYRERGYLSADVQVEGPTIFSDRTAEAAFRVKEGPQAIVRDIRYAGLPDGFDPRRYPVLKVGDPFRFSGVEETLRELSRGLGRSGYLFARVEGESSVSKEGTDAFVTLKVEHGPRVRVGKIVVNGTDRTQESMVRANLVMRQGGVLDPEALFESQRNLVRLGVFRNVAVRLMRPDEVEESKDVLVDVRERPRLAGEVGGGYSLVDGVRAVGDFAYPNLGGRGTSLSGRLKVNYVGSSALVASGVIDAPDGVLDGIDFRGNMALAQPRIWNWYPAKVGTRLDLVGERVHRPAFTFLRYAAVAGVDWAARDWLNLAVQYEIEHDRVRLSPTANDLLRLRRSDLERVRFGHGNFSLWSVRPSFTLDFRDDFARPTKGFLFSGVSEFTRDLGAEEILPSGEPEDFRINTLKLSGNATGYIPLSQRVVFALSARAGKIFHLEEGSRTIAPRRFYLGGTSSMRGFREDGMIPEDRRAALREDIGACVGILLPEGCSAEAEHLLAGNELPSEGGELYTLGKAELRFPLFGALDAGIFVEAGNLWLRPEFFDPLRLRYVGGAGVRYGTPIGPVALDLGVNLLPDPYVNEQRANLHFSIGLF